jgi:hypothetical protein
MLPGKARTQRAAWKRQAGSSRFLAGHGVIGKQNDNGREKQRDEDDRTPKWFVPYYLHNAIHRKSAATLDSMQQTSFQFSLSLRLF